MVTALSGRSSESSSRMLKLFICLVPSDGEVVPAGLKLPVLRKLVFRDSGLLIG